MKKLLSLLAAAAAALALFSCQKEKVIELTVSPVAVSFNVEGGEASVTIDCNDAWTVTKSADWITLSATSGSGKGTLKITAAESKEFEARETKVLVAAGEKRAEVTVTQLGQAPGLEVNPASVEVAAAGETVDVTVTANVDWTVSIPEDAAWIKADPLSGSGEGKVTFTVAPNIYLEPRTAKVTVNGTMNLSREIEFTQAKAAESRQTDSIALVKLFNAFGGADKMKSDRAWDLSKPINEWYGITVTDGRVSALKFLKGTLTGDWTIPASIGELTELTELRFVDCKVGGAIPEELYTLVKLTTLYLTNNKVTGSLSAKIGNLTELTNVYIDQNPELGGSLPAEIGQLTKLVNLNIAKTSFSGAIPQSLTNLHALKNFMAYSTKFNEMPDFWDQLESLELVQLYDIPTLTGPLPASLGRCAKLKNIYMYDCNFEGNIPEEWANLPATMLNVRVQGNKLQGEVPAAVVAHPKWTNWKPEQYILPQQEGYGLTVAPPLTPRQLDSLVLVKIYEIADGDNWKASRKWDLAKPIDEWPGIKVNEEGRITELSITNGTNTTKDWELPEELATLTELKTFQAIGSKVVGELPEFLYTMTKLTNIRLNTNPNLGGTLSTKLDQLTELTDLYINGTGISGSLPSTIGNLKKLKNINIAQSKIGGAIPAELTGCTSLANFMAYDCELSGEVPDFWDQFANIGIIQLYNNKGLVGSLPASCGRATTTATTYSLRFDGCNFTGNIPESYATLPSVCKQFWAKGNKLSGVVPAGVQAHANWNNWKAAENILPQQEGYGLTLQ